MNDDLRELYQDIILDHGRHPRNFGECEHANLNKEGYNPLCGDKIHISIREKNGVIEEIKFQGSGCAISMASASLMTEHLRNKTMEEFDALFQDFHEVVTTREPQEAAKERLGKLAIFSGVSEFPARVKCATLAWHTVKGAILNNREKVTTEG